MEAVAGGREGLEACTAEKLEALWSEAKQGERADLESANQELPPR